MRDALETAARMKAVYLPATLVALAAALLGSRRSAPRAAGCRRLRRRRWPQRSTCSTRSFPVRTRASCGRSPRTRSARSRAPSGALAAIALLATARGLSRRRRRAWQVATAVAGLSTVLHVLHGLNGGTLASAVVLVVLVARRHDFDGPGDPTTRRRVLARVAVAASAVVVYGTAALWVNRVAADQSFDFEVRGSRRSDAGCSASTWAARRTSRARSGPGSRCRCSSLGSGRRPLDRRGLDRPVAPPRRPARARARARPGARSRVGRRHARSLRPAGRQVVLLRGGQDGVPRLPRRRRSRDRLRRPDRPERSRRRSDRHVRAVRARPRLAPRDPRRLRAVARALRQARAPRAVPRRRGDRRHRARSRSTAARSGRSDSRCTAWPRPATGPRYGARARSTPTSAVSSKRSRTSGAATPPSEGS